MNRCEVCGSQTSSCPESCPECGAFATLLPFEPPAPPTAAPAFLAVDAGDIAEDATRKISTGLPAWDDVLSGGVVLGGSVVIYGGPGAKKTTRAGAIADFVACVLRGRALFLSAEMPSPMVRDAIQRVRLPRALSIIGAERDANILDRCLSEVLRLRPRVVVYDSIQAFEVGSVEAGTDFGISATVRLARKYAAQLNHVAILISQVNKSGQPAGPHRTIHDCDTIIELEHDKIRVEKNRYAPAPRDAVLT